MNSLIGDGHLALTCWKGETFYNASRKVMVSLRPIAILERKAFHPYIACSSCMEEKRWRCVPVVMAPWHTVKNLMNYIDHAFFCV
jgi:hypothetical protein